MYVINSSLHFKTDISIRDNQAHKFGGGVHAVDSSVTIGNIVQIDNNEAMFGGGLSLANSTILDENMNHM